FALRGGELRVWQSSTGLFQHEGDSTSPIPAFYRLRSWLSHSRLCIVLDHVFLLAACSHVVLPNLVDLILLDESSKRNAVLVRRQLPCHRLRNDLQPASPERRWQEN